MFCKNCGQQIQDGATFCPNCGTPVAQQPSQGAAQPSNGNGGKAFNIDANILKLVGMGAGFIAFLSLLFSWLSAEGEGLSFFGITSLASEVSGGYAFLWVLMIILTLAAVIAVVGFQFLGKPKLSLYSCGVFVLDIIVVLIVKGRINSLLMGWYTISVGFGFILFFITTIVAIAAAILVDKRKK